MLICAVLFVQLAAALFVATRYPKSTATLLRAIATLIDAASTAAKTDPGRKVHRVVASARHTRRRSQAAKDAAASRELEAPSDRIEGDLIRTLVNLGSSESNARKHVLALRERGLIWPGMAIEAAMPIAFQQLKPSVT